MTTGRIVRRTAAVAGCVALLGAGTAAPSKKVSAERYAKTLCATIDGLGEALGAFDDEKSCKDGVQVFG